MEKKKILLAVTGASGSVYAKMLMREIAALHGQLSGAAVIFSETSLKVWEYELGEKPQVPDVFRVFRHDDFFAPAASGSSGYSSMIICPCSMGTLGRIAGGISDDLITRSADVMLKEKRNLVLVPRETPYNLIHLQNMERLMLAGARILPASPSFYSRPGDIDALLMTVVERILVQAGLETGHFEWGSQS